MLIAIEGVDFSGKTTLAKELFEKLKQNNLDFDYGKPIVYSNHYSQPLASEWRKLFINEEYPNTHVEEFFLSMYAHSRGLNYQLSDLLDNNHIVIMDRYLGSMLAMQALIHGDSKLLNIMTQCIDLIGFPKPDLSIVIISNERIFNQRKNALIKHNNYTLDKFEKNLWLEYHEPLQWQFHLAARILNSKSTISVDAELPSNRQVELVINELNNLYK